MSTGTPSLASPLPGAAGAPPAGVRSLQATARDVWRYHAAIVARSAATFTVMLLCHQDVVSVWVLVLANLLLYPPEYLRVHDIGHAVPSSRFGWAARFVPVSNPIRQIALNATLAASSRSKPRRRTKAQQLYSVDVVVLVYFFNFYTHRASFSADAPIGTWDREEGMGLLLPALRGVWGRGIDGLAYHNRHHCLGQMHVPVENYRYLTDTGRYTRFCDGWPIGEVQQL